MHGRESVLVERAAVSFLGGVVVRNLQMPPEHEEGSLDVQNARTRGVKGAIMIY